MRFTSIVAALLGLTAARNLGSGLVEAEQAGQAAATKEATEAIRADTETGVEVAPSQKKVFNKGYWRRVKDPNVRARYQNAMDNCREHHDKRKKYKCFVKNWNLFKPHRKNNLTDVRARAQRACWKYKNNPQKRGACFKKYIRVYKAVLKKGLLAHTMEDQDINESNEIVKKSPIKPVKGLDEVVEPPAEFDEDEDHAETQHSNSIDAVVTPPPE